MAHLVFVQRGRKLIESLRASDARDGWRLGAPRVLELVRAIFCAHLACARREVVGAAGFARTEDHPHMERAIHRRGLVRLRPAIDHVHLARAIKAVGSRHARCRKEFGVVVDPHVLIGRPPALLCTSLNRWTRLFTRRKDGKLARRRIEQLLVEQRVVHQVGQHIARTVAAALATHRLEPQLSTEDASFYLPLGRLVEVGLACVLPSAMVMCLSKKKVLY